MNQTYLFVYLVSTIFLSLLQQSTLRNQNPARNPNLGWLHMCQPNSVLEIASVRLSTKSDKSGSRLVVKPLRLSTRPRQMAGKISFKTQCWIQTAQIYEKSSKVWTVLLVPTHQTKQCPTTVIALPTSNPKPTYS